LKKLLRGEIMKFEKAKFREDVLPIDADSTYTILGSTVYLRGMYPVIFLQLSKEDTGTKHTMTIHLPHNMDRIDPTTKFGRLIKAFGDDTDNWVGKRVHIAIDIEGKKCIHPIRN
jgi:hypothetical protein